MALHTITMFTFLSAEEPKGWNLRVGASTKKHDQYDTLSVVLSPWIHAAAPWSETENSDQIKGI